MPLGGVLASYRGSKTRFAGPIVDALEGAFGPVTGWPAFVDVCAGTASVLIEALRRAPRLGAVAVDAGAWGAFWCAFQADRAGVEAGVSALVDEGKAAVCRRLAGTARTVDPTRWAAEFLLVQGAMRHGQPIPLDDEGNWHRNPNACIPGSARASHTGLVARLAAVPRFAAVHARAERMTFPRGAIVYIDPPYLKTMSGYAVACDVPAIVRNAVAAGCRVAVSHHTAYPGVEGPIITITAARCLRDVCRRELLILPAMAR